MVRIEELYTAFLKFQESAKVATADPRNFSKIIKPARLEFQEFCEKHNLAIDFTSRNE